MRLKIVSAILRLIVKKDANCLQNGLALTEIYSEIEKICRESKEEPLDISNITQELGMLHMREENRQTTSNFIPLFFFDKGNRKLLIIEPTIYQIKEYNSDLLMEIVMQINSSIRSEPVMC